MYIETKIHEYSLFVGLVDQRVRVLVCVGYKLEIRVPLPEIVLI